MYDVENVFTYVHVMLLCLKIGFVVIYAILLGNLFCGDLRTFVWKKLNQILHMWRKNDKYQVCTSDDEEVSDDEDMGMRSNWGAKEEEERGLRVV